MAFKLIIQEKADFEIIAAYLYYEEKQPGLGDIFLAQLDFYFNWIKTYPLHFAEKSPPFREAILKRFPFAIIYEVTENEVIIYSVFNTWQDPEKKTPR